MNRQDAREKRPQEAYSAGSVQEGERGIEIL